MLRIEAARDVEESARIYAAVEEHLGSKGVDPQDRHRVQLLIEELFVNFATHGVNCQTGACAIEVEASPQRIACRLIDDGEPFDPWNAAPATHVEAALEDRPVGGLGLHLARQLAASYDYRRDDGRNIVTFEIQRA